MVDLYVYNVRDDKRYLTALFTMHSKVLMPVGLFLWICKYQFLLGPGFQQ